jgi:hypothetical protein
MFFFFFARVFLVHLVEGYYHFRGGQEYNVLKKHFYLEDKFLLH